MFQIWEKKHLNTRMLTSTFTFEGKCVSKENEALFQSHLSHLWILSWSLKGWLDLFPPPASFSSSSLSTSYLIIITITAITVIFIIMIMTFSTTAILIVFQVKPALHPFSRAMKWNEMWNKSRNIIAVCSIVIIVIVSQPVPRFHKWWWQSLQVAKGMSLSSLSPESPSPWSSSKIIMSLIFYYIHHVQGLNQAHQAWTWWRLCPWAWWPWSPWSRPLSSWPSWKWYHLSGALSLAKNVDVWLMPEKSNGNVKRHVLVDLLHNVEMLLGKS